MSALSCACVAVLLAACGGGSDSTVAEEVAPETTAAAAPAPATTQFLATTAVSTTSTTTTTTWTRCAAEYGVCSFSGTRQVRYGLNGRYATRTATGSIACNNTVFGDPYPGANKICEYATTTTTPAPAPTVTWQRCAAEYGTCTVPSTTQVRYGLNGRYAMRTVTGSIACNNTVFGDPYPGANKICEFATPTSAPAPAPAPAPTPSPAPAPSPSWVRCAAEYGTCTVPSTTQVRYGLNGR